VTEHKHEHKSDTHKKAEHVVEKKPSAVATAEPKKHEKKKLPKIDLTDEEDQLRRAIKFCEHEAEAAMKAHKPVASARWTAAAKKGEAALGACTSARQASEVFTGAVEAAEASKPEDEPKH
jgi:hypothetical protein